MMTLKQISAVAVSSTDALRLPTCNFSYPVLKEYCRGGQEIAVSEHVRVCPQGIEHCAGYSA